MYEIPFYFHLRYSLSLHMTNLFDYPCSYQINLGIGHIELQQVDFKPGNLLTKYLVASNVYILDCHTDVFVW